MKKTRIFALALALLTLASCLSLAACKKEPAVHEAFVGEYTSTFVDAQMAEDAISYTLSMKADMTFTLTRTEAGEQKWSYSGTWKTDTANGETEVLCLFKDYQSADYIFITDWNPTFTLSFLDDGSLKAVPMIGNASATVSPFGNGADVMRVGLVLFAKS